MAVLGDRLLLKLYRRIEEGLHPEVEMNRVLFAKDVLHASAAAAGALAVSHPNEAERSTLGIASGIHPQRGRRLAADKLDALHRFFDHILAGATGPPQLEAGPRLDGGTK